ncbi:MAG: hypothetical protein J5I93_22240 [Pirellulaceae bacterium]|nr:hypothetical protein [Pirellulaceae bacterium]
MTLLGKIFTMLILVMSVLFMGFSIAVFATHRQWDKVVNNPNPDPSKGEQLGLKQQVEQQKQVNEELRRELEKSKAALAQEQAARRHILGNLYSQLDQRVQELSDKQKELDALNAFKSTATETLNTNANTLEKLTKEVMDLRDEIRVAEEDRNAQFSKVVSLTDQVNRTQGLYDQLEERRTQLALQITRMKGVMDKLGITVDTPTDNIPPKLDGWIVAVGATNTDLVEISLGSDDGIRKGHQLDVYRNGQYLGRIVVMETQPDRAVATILKEYRRGIIKKDDRVSTKLSLG